MASPHSPSDSFAINPYRIRVSQRYLDLTRQKLELTRLPREVKYLHGGPVSDAGIAKSNLEPLVDFWTERYDWRAEETRINDTLPQFRTTVLGTRLHFIHKTSTTPQSIPLLFIHGWPESFLAVAPIIDALCEPARSPGHGMELSPTFRVVGPTIPGFGFSDAVAEEGNNYLTTAEIFDALMKRLGYTQYIVHGSGWGFKIARAIALRHPESCMAVHTVNPEMPTPMAAGSFGMQDLSMSPSAPMTPGTPSAASISAPSTPPTSFEKPQTMSYALCDSPAGLLAFVTDLINPTRSATPRSARPSPTPHPSPQMARSPASMDQAQAQIQGPWTSTALINWTMMHWLPGPEVALRWLSNSAESATLLWNTYSTVPLGISHYSAQTPPGTPRTNQGPPAWAEAYHRVAIVRRRVGDVRFATWERPMDVVMDLRELATLVWQSLYETQMMGSQVLM